MSWVVIDKNKSNGTPLAALQIHDMWFTGHVTPGVLATVPKEAKSRGPASPCEIYRANLLAMAPEMLKALELVIGFIEGRDIETGEPVVHRDPFNHVRAVIAKAKGGAA